MSPMERRTSPEPRPQGAPVPLTLTVYSDYVCPWCYVGSAVVDRLANERPLTVDWQPFFLHPDTPPEGLRMSPDLRARMSGAHDRLRAMARDAGLPMVFPDVIPNTRRALEATEYARAAGRLEPFHREVAHRYYGLGLDIADWDVLADAATAAGLDPEAMRRAVDEGEFRDALDDAIADAGRIGVSAVPTYVLDGRYGIVGAQPIEVFRQVITQIEEAEGAS